MYLGRSCLKIRATIALSSNSPDDRCEPFNRACFSGVRFDDDPVHLGALMEL